MTSFVVSESLDSLEGTIVHGRSHPDYSFDVISLKIFGQISVRQYTFPETYTGQAYYSTFVKLINEYILPKFEKSAQNFEDYLQQLDTSYLISNTEGLQKLKEFTVANLNTIRNQIMHEGLSYSPYIEFLLIELEGILIDTILALLTYGNKKHMNQIVIELNKPFYPNPTKLDGYNPNMTYSINL